MRKSECIDEFRRERLSPGNSVRSTGQRGASRKPCWIRNLPPAVVKAFKCTGNRTVIGINECDKFAPGLCHPQIHGRVLATVPFAEVSNGEKRLPIGNDLPC